MKHTTLVLPLFFLLACGESDDQSAQPKRGSPSGNTACERYFSLSSQLSDANCATPAALNCTIPAACEALANAWVDCIATDLSQCICEPDGDMNCEGSYKADEGPAKCIEQYQKLDACLDDN